MRHGEAGPGDSDEFRVLDQEQPKVPGAAQPCSGLSVGWAGGCQELLSGERLRLPAEKSRGACFIAAERSPRRGPLRLGQRQADLRLAAGSTSWRAHPALHLPDMMPVLL